MSHVHVHVIHFRWGGGGGGCIADVSMLGQRYIDGLNSEFDNKSWYHYVLCPGTTMCYVLVPLCVMSWYHYVLCPGTTMCYVLVPLCVMSWYHYVLCPGTTMCYVLVPLCVVRNRPPNIQASSLLKTIQATIVSAPHPLPQPTLLPPPPFKQPFIELQPIGCD